MLTKALSDQAERAFKNKNWKQACTHYDTYFKKVYPEPDAEMSLPDTKMLLHYAQSLFCKVQSEAVNSKYDLEELENVTAYVLTARRRFEAFPDEMRIDDVVDTHELLGQVALMNNQFDQSVQEFTEGYQKACAGGAPWNLRLSMLFNKVLALEMREKPQLAIAALEECIALADEELSAQPPPETVEKLNDFKREFSEKMKQLQEDAKEQAANPDLAKEEAAEDGAEGEGEEEEEEEDANEEDDGAPPPEPTPRPDPDAPDVDVVTKE
jgi:hypothetical protein